MFDSDYVMTSNYSITYVANTIKKIYLGTTILNEFAYTYYDNKNDSF